MINFNKDTPMNGLINYLLKIIKDNLDLLEVNTTDPKAPINSFCCYATAPIALSKTATLVKINKNPNPIPNLSVSFSTNKTMTKTVPFPSPSPAPLPFNY